MSTQSLNEQWRPILQGAYEVSNHGRVRRLLPYRGAKVGRVLKPATLRTGYLYVALRVNSKRVAGHSRVHRLVYEGFYGAIPNGLVINHKDGNKANNRLGNLEAVTPSENNQHATRTGLRRPAAGHKLGVHKIKLSEAEVETIRRLWDGGNGMSQSAIARRYETPVRTICGICNMTARKFKRPGLSQII